MQELDTIGEKIRQAFETKNTARESALTTSRELIRHCSLAIRATHRGEYIEAQHLLTRTREIAAQLKTTLAAHPDLYFTGYVQDALKELAEAHIVYALITDAPLPDPDALGIEYAAYLNGLGEATGELRRYVLDIIRHDTSARAEKMLTAMEDIYALLVTMDFPDALTGGLRRTTDLVRGVLERTRGDLTVAVRQDRLEQTLYEFERKFERGENALDSRKRNQ